MNEANHILSITRKKKLTDDYYEMIRVNRMDRLYKISLPFNVYRVNWRHDLNLMSGFCISYVYV